MRKNVVLMVKKGKIISSNISAKVEILEVIDKRISRLSKICTNLEQEFLPVYLENNLCRNGFFADGFDKLSFYKKEHFHYSLCVRIASYRILKERMLRGDDYYA